MHYGFLFVISLLFFVLTFNVGESWVRTGVSFFILALTFLVLGIVSPCVLDCKYSYEGQKTIVKNPHGDNDHKCWVETTGGNHFLHSSWKTTDKVYIYKLESENFLGFIVRSGNKEHDVGFILRNGKDKHLDSFIEKREN